MVSFKTPYAPEDVGYDASRLEVLNDHFIRMMKAGELTSANYCLSLDGKVFANNALGKFSYKEDDPREVQPDTIQWIASITKIITAAAVFKIFEDGRIRLNQNAGEILEEMNDPPFNQITIAHLLSHTSGLNADPNAFENKYFNSSWDLIATRQGKSWLEAGLSCGMRNKPGVEWAYCTFGFVLLGEIITRVLGRNVYDFIEKEILEPCGMKDSFFPDHPLRNEAEREARIAALKRFNVRDAAKEKEVAYLLAVASGEKKPKPSPFDGVPMTGSNLVSTAQDLNRFGVMLLNNGTIDGKRILGRRTVTRMTENYTNQGIQDFCWNAGGAYRMYGLGPDTRRTADSLYSDGTFFHEGAGACSLIIDPEERLVASWFVPFSKPNAWLPHGLYSASAIMWSGLK